jgi:hypothetical protein
MKDLPFYHVPNQIRDGSATQTIRLHNYHLKVGDLVRAVVKKRGYAPDAREVLATLEITAVSKVRLQNVTQTDVDREGFGGHTPATFIIECVRKYKCDPTTMFWRYRFINRTTDPLPPVYPWPALSLRYTFAYDVDLMPVDHQGTLRLNPQATDGHYYGYQPGNGVPRNCAFYADNTARTYTADFTYRKPDGTFHTWSYHGTYPADWTAEMFFNNPNPLTNSAPQCYAKPVH